MFNFWLSFSEFWFIYHNFDLLCQKSELLTHNPDLVSQKLSFLSHNFDFLFHFIFWFWPFCQNLDSLTHNSTFLSHYFNPSDKIWTFQCHNSDFFKIVFTFYIFILLAKNTIPACSLSLHAVSSLRGFSLDIRLRRETLWTLKPSQCV